MLVSGSGPLRKYFKKYFMEFVALKSDFYGKNEFFAELPGVFKNMLPPPIPSISTNLMYDLRLTNYEVMW